MSPRYQLLHVEDSPEDAELLRYALDGTSSSFNITRVETEADYAAQLESCPPDVILCDYDLPNFSAERALEISRERNLDLPFIIVSHHVDETAAVVAMQKGASDYLAKRNLGRLSKAIEAAVDNSNARREKIKAQEALRASEEIRRIALERSNERLQTLSKRMLTIQEEERRAISRELHDDIGQTLSALKIGLHRLATTSAAEHPALVAECLGAADQALAKLRLLAMDLRPPQLDQLGLQEALEWLAQRQSAASGLAIACKFGGIGTRPPPAVEGACYRIAQEALNNATRHAKAKAVLISVESDAAVLTLVIHDDGIGFDEQAARQQLARSGSMGLIGMEERAQLAGGRLKLRTAPGAGTTITATFPL